MTGSRTRGLLVTILAIPALAIGIDSIADGRTASTEAGRVQPEVVQEETPTCEASADEPLMTSAADGIDGLEEEAMPDDALGPKALGYRRWDCSRCYTNADCAGRGSVCHPICP
jgi:hypothetical protein